MAAQSPAHFYRMFGSERQNAPFVSFLPPQLQSISFNHGHAGPIALSLPVQNSRDPCGISRSGPVHPEVTDLCGRHVQGKEPACDGIYPRKIHEPQVASINLMPADSLVVIQKVAAPVENELAPVHFNRFYVVGGMAVDHIDPCLVDQAVAESFFII